MGYRGGSVKDWSPTEPDVSQKSFDEFMDAYIEAALWSSVDETDPDTGGESLDANYDSQDIHPETAQEMEGDAWDFVRSNWEDIWEDLPQAGRDFWLTRAGHGAGFWDGGWQKEVGERLTEASKAFGEYNLHVGDDGKIYGHQ